MLYVGKILVASIALFLAPRLSKSTNTRVQFPILHRPRPPAFRLSLSILELRYSSKLCNASDFQSRPTISTSSTLSAWSKASHTPRSLSRQFHWQTTSNSMHHLLSACTHLHSHFAIFRRTSTGSQRTTQHSDVPELLKSVIFASPSSSQACHLGELFCTKVLSGFMTLADYISRYITFHHVELHGRAARRATRRNGSRSTYRLNTVKKSFTTRRVF